MRTAAKTAAGRLVTDPRNNAVPQSYRISAQREGEIVLTFGLSDEGEMPDHFSLWTLRSEAAHKPHDEPEQGISIRLDERSRPSRPRPTSPGTRLRTRERWTVEEASRSALESRPGTREDRGCPVAPAASTGQRGSPDDSARPRASFIDGARGASVGRPRSGVREVRSWMTSTTCGPSSSPRRSMSSRRSRAARTSTSGGRTTRRSRTSAGRRPPTTSPTSSSSGSSSGSAPAAGPATASSRARGGRRRKWTPERIRDELEDFCDEIGGWPRAAEFKETGRGDLYLAASRYGGIEHWAEELGFGEPEPTPSRPPPASAGWPERREPSRSRSSSRSGSGSSREA